MKLHQTVIKAQAIALHPRTAAITEVAYATHGIFHANHWTLTVIYTALIIISLAHFIWVSTAH